MSTEKTEAKPRIAVMGMGTFDAGALGIPVMIDLFTRLSAHFEIVFYSFLPIDKSLLPEGITVRRPLKWRIPGRIKYMFVAFRCALDHLSNPFSTFFAVSVYPAGLSTTILGKIFRRPSVVQMIATEGGSESIIPLGNLIVPWLRKITLSVTSKADFVVAVADYQKRIAVKNLSTRNEIVVLPLRINSELFPYKKRTITAPVQFIQIGFYGPIKDQDTMFAGFARIAEKIDCHLTVVGDGFDIPKVRQMIQSLGIADKVAFAGYVRNADLTTRLSNAHILLHTALFETGCAVIQEAMASGVAVCGTQVGILDDIGDKYAAMFQPGDAEGLAEEALKLVSDPDFFESITSEAHQWIVKHDAKWAYENYLAFFTEIIKKER
jgi:glycosyltransferase involved in cell wall biosynthesis